MSKHTQYELPYKFEPWDGRVVDNNDMYVDPDHILKLLNSHAKLVEALRESLKIMEMYEEELDGELGPGRDFKQIVADGDEPEAMKRYRTLLAQLDGEVR